MCAHGEFHQYPRLGPRPQPSLESHFARTQIVFVFNNQTSLPLSLLRVDPRVGDDPERMRGLPVGVFCARKLPKQQLAVVRPATAESQLAAALMGGSWEGARVLLDPSACDA